PSPSWSVQGHCRDRHRTDDKLRSSVPLTRRRACDPALEIPGVPAGLRGILGREVVALDGVEFHVEEAGAAGAQLVDELVRAVAEAEQAEGVVGEEERHPGSRV